MAEKRQVLRNLYEKNIKGSGLVIEENVFICFLTTIVSREVISKSENNKVYINSKALKHVYDKRPAEEFDFIVDNIHTVIKYPDLIYKNKNPKRGDFCFIKKLKGSDYLCSLEISETGLDFVTAFRLRKPKYLNEYELLWSWRNDTSSS